MCFFQEFQKLINLDKVSLFVKKDFFVSITFEVIVQGVVALGSHFAI